MRRNNGEGSLTQRPDGSWAVSLMVQGKRRWLYAKTKRDAERQLAALQREVARHGGLPDPGKRSVGDLLTAWLEAAAPSLKPATLDHYQQVCERYLLPAIGRLRLSRLSPDVVQRLVTPYQQQGKRRTAAKVYRTLHRACEVAVLWGWLGSNPCDRILRPKHQPERKEVWSEADVRRFLDGARGHPLYALYLLLITSGVRLGECLALRWSDLDFSTGVLTVARSVQRLKGEVVFSTPKTKAAVRSVHLPPMVLAELHPPLNPDSSLMFTNARGGVLHPSVVQHQLTRLCAELSLPKVTPHGLRHLHASLLLSGGVPLSEVSRRLGHASPAVTMGIYAHCLHSDERAADVIGRVCSYPAPWHLPLEESHGG